MCVGGGHTTWHDFKLYEDNDAFQACRRSIWFPHVSVKATLERPRNSRNYIIMSFDFPFELKGGLECTWHSAVFPSIYPRVAWILSSPLHMEGRKELYLS